MEADSAAADELTEDRALALAVAFYSKIKEEPMANYDMLLDGAVVAFSSRGATTNRKQVSIRYTVRNKQNAEVLGGVEARFFLSRKDRSARWEAVGMHAPSDQCARGFCRKCPETDHLDAAALAAD